METKSRVDTKRRVEVGGLRQRVGGWRQRVGGHRQRIEGWEGGDKEEGRDTE